MGEWRSCPAKYLASQAQGKEGVQVGTVGHLLLTEAASESGLSDRLSEGDLAPDRGQQQRPWLLRLGCGYDHAQAGSRQRARLSTG
jgi:hypothetical protein